MLNATSSFDIPPLPTYTLTPLPPVVPGIPDKYLQLIAPVVAYWGVSLFFHILDVFDLCSQYRLHTPAEVLKRNHVSRYEVFRDVIIQQVVQTIAGAAMGWMDPDEMMGREHYEEMVWAQRLRRAQRTLPYALGLLGLDSTKLGNGLMGSYPMLGGVISGGNYPGLMQNIITAQGQEILAPTFAQWELLAAKAIYWFLIPAIQFFLGAFIVDTWQYFLHRGMHMNKWLYTTLHSRHHRLYVPYAYGALYNHPIEGFTLDTLGTGLAYLVTRMSTRQGLVFFTASTIKTVDDHCGYAFPWDPLQHFTNNNAAYHDVHHQSWGIKTNFSQPFSTFWDRILGTTWSGGDISLRYERSRLSAQKQLDADEAMKTAPVTHNPAVDVPKAQVQSRDSKSQVLRESDHNGARVLQEERKEEMEARQMLRRSVRKRSIDPKSDTLRGLRERVTGIASNTCT
ncbi:MAG: hypothetical protein Q9227_003940 [Pyrenula ochraceoflavens]